MREPTAVDVMMLASWYVLYGVELWGLLLVIGYAFQRLHPNTSIRTRCHDAAWRGAQQSRAWRSRQRVGDGFSSNRAWSLSSQSMHLYAFISGLIMALLFFAHLQRSRAHEEAAARLAAAQAAQREARRRLAHARLQAVQARIDPQLLFDMLDAVRRCLRR